MKTYNIPHLNFTGTAEQLVRLLHKASRAPCKTDEDWMKEFAGRVRLMRGGKSISTDTAEAFVAAIIKLNLIDEMV